MGEVTEERDEVRRVRDEGKVRECGSIHFDALSNFDS